MKSRAQIQRLPDGRRLYLHDGPMDVILEAFGPPADVRAAYAAATRRFATILDELCSELLFCERLHGRMDRLLLEL